MDTESVDRMIQYHASINDKDRAHILGLAYKLHEALNAITAATRQGNMSAIEHAKGNAIAAENSLLAYYNKDK